jgi:putative membrane protein
MIRMASQTGATVEKLSTGAESPMGINTRLAFERTNLAHERTLMAWVRTATALISFGFTIYKFFELEKANVLAIQSQIIGPHRFAILMIATGILSLVMATIEHRQHVMSMRKQHVEMRRSLAAWVAGLISVLGLLAMGAVIFRL